MRTSTLEKKLQQIGLVYNCWFKPCDKDVENYFEWGEGDGDYIKIYLEDGSVMYAYTDYDDDEDKGGNNIKECVMFDEEGDCYYVSPEEMLKEIKSVINK